MKTLIQLGIGLACAGGTLVIIVLLVISELNFKDLQFSFLIGLLGVLSAISFMVLTRNDDNEETDPVKDKVK
jgi:hypothetical protein